MGESPVAGTSWRVGLIRLALGAGFVCASWVVLGAEQAHAADGGKPPVRAGEAVVRTIRTVEPTNTLTSTPTRVRTPLAHAAQRIHPVVVRPVEHAVSHARVVRAASAVVSHVPLVSRPVGTLRTTVGQTATRVDQTVSRVGQTVSRVGQTVTSVGQTVTRVGTQLLPSRAAASSPPPASSSPPGARAEVPPAPSGRVDVVLARLATVVPRPSVGEPLAAAQTGPNAPPSPASPFDVTPVSAGGVSGSRSGATDFGISERWAPQATPHLSDPPGIAVSRVVVPAPRPIHRPD